DAIATAPSCRISAASLLEVSIVAESRGGDLGVRQCDSFFRNSRVSVDPVTEEHALLARQGYSDFGKGRHPAGLNFGDCFSYALAKATGEQSEEHTSELQSPYDLVCRRLLEQKNQSED